ncbi:hypothetical protein [Synechococcus phage BUCT-ZZ01]|nr:hypothetical protein [Synechococcus phage BUCT-ZZ01]
MAGTAIWVNGGQNLAIDLLDPATRAGVTTSYTIAWGSGSTAPAVTDTALVSENPETRVAATVSQPAVDTIRFVGTITATANRTVQEAGVFTNTGANLFLRGVHALLNIETGDRVEYTFDLRLKDNNEA